MTRISRIGKRARLARRFESLAVASRPLQRRSRRNAFMHVSTCVLTLRTVRHYSALSSQNDTIAEKPFRGKRVKPRTCL